MVFVFSLESISFCNVIFVITQAQNGWFAQFETKMCQKKPLIFDSVDKRITFISLDLVYVLVHHSKKVGSLNCHVV